MIFRELNCNSSLNVYFFVLKKGNKDCLDGSRITQTTDVIQLEISSLKLIFVAYRDNKLLKITHLLEHLRVEDRP